MPTPPTTAVTPTAAAVSPLPLGQTTTTPAALAALLSLGLSPATYLDRHARGDWGETDADGRRANEGALRDAGQVISEYDLPSGDRLFVVTEWDRSVTTLCLPSEL